MPATRSTARRQRRTRVKQADFDKTLRTRVIAKNARGQGDAYSPATDVVKDADSGDIIALPDGSKSVDVKNIPAREQRLIVDKVVFSPNPLTSTTQSCPRSDPGEGHARLRRAGRDRLHPHDTESGGRW